MPCDKKGSNVFKSKVFIQIQLLFQLAFYYTFILKNTTYNLIASTVLLVSCIGHTLNKFLSQHVEYTIQWKDRTYPSSSLNYAHLIIYYCDDVHWLYIIINVWLSLAAESYFLQSQYCHHWSWNGSYEVEN